MDSVGPYVEANDSHMISDARLFIIFLKKKIAPRIKNRVRAIPSLVDLLVNIFEQLFCESRNNSLEVRTMEAAYAYPVAHRIDSKYFLSFP
jgi:hypothetical protein